MNSRNTPALDLDRCRAAWQRVESGAALPAPPAPADLRHRERQLADASRALRRIDRVGLAATLLFALVLSPTVTAAAIPMPEQAMNINHHVSHAAVIDSASQIVEAL